MNFREAVHASFSDDPELAKKGLDYLKEKSVTGKLGTKNLCQRLLKSLNNPEEKPVVKFKMADLDRAYANEKKRDDILFD